MTSKTAKTRMALSRVHTSAETADVAKLLLNAGKMRSIWWCPETLT